MANYDQNYVSDKLCSILTDSYSLTPDAADDSQLYDAAATIVRDILSEKLRHFRADISARGEKQVYYLSMEFLLGRSLKNDLYNLGLTGTFSDALERWGVSLDRLYDCEPDAGLGNGGLGRLAACFMDGLATCNLPAMGYSICFEYGIFAQKLVDGWQTELPDNWLPGGRVWLRQHSNKAVDVRFGGQVEEFWRDGYHHMSYKNYKTVKATPFDIVIPGYKSDAVSRLRLWKASAPGLDMELFNRGDYSEAMEQQSMAEAISAILYPNDNHIEGKILRLKQQYFLVCASLSDIIRRHMANYGTMENFPDKVAIHINDTHPSLAIPELMRVLLDECGYTWEKAWDITTRTFTYTNHTVMPEALETWNEDMMEELIPRIHSIIVEINSRLCRSLYEDYHQNDEQVGRMCIRFFKSIRMANLAVAGSHMVNGVSRHHLEIMKESVFADFARVWPERFTSVTNGIAARRWLCQANPELTVFVKKYVGADFEHDYEKMSMLKKYQNDASVLDELAAIKHRNKERFAKHITDVSGAPLNVDSIFDVQAKRLHEYKRQHMNALRIISLYNQLCDNPNMDFIPRTFIFGAKAAPGYYLAKRIIKLLWMLGEELAANPATRGKLQLVYLENYSVTTTELLMPAAEISEQISLAGTEASGTGNMKLMLDGAITVGTLDGANVEIRQAVGADNFLLFGMDSDEVAASRLSGYRPKELIDADPELSAVLDRLKSGLGGISFSDIAEMLENMDTYMAVKDFRSYCNIQDRASSIYADPRAWNKMSLNNIAAAPVFFADRAVTDYARDIWGMIE